VLPISASLYSKPLGNAMRALCSSPVAGFLIGSTSDCRFHEWARLKGPRQELGRFDPGRFCG
jgi:hypothetical protein